MNHGGTEGTEEGKMRIDVAAYCIEDGVPVEVSVEHALKMVDADRRYKSGEAKRMVDLVIRSHNGGTVRYDVDGVRLVFFEAGGEWVKRRDSVVEGLLLSFIACGICIAIGAALVKAFVDQ